MSRFWIALALISPLLLAAGAGVQSQLPPPIDREVRFAEDVHPILAERCFQCHGPGKDRGGFSLDSRESVLEGSDLGPVVVEGNSAESYLVQLLVGTEDGLRMPPKGDPLSSDQIGVIRAWIDQGLPWELDPAQDEPLYTSPLKPRRPDVPEGPQANPIDRILAAYFDKHGIEPREPVSDRVFAQRVYYDIIGLPPTPKQLEAFLQDDSPEKRRELVRSLLDDDQGYAEHWMTYWNDLLRNDYTGTGYIDGGRKQITKWLYEALYMNLPYDQLVTQLLAPTPESEGFINGIKWRGAVNASQATHMQAAQNVSQLFLGVNLKCASCHDSFVNQWTLDEAYGMAAVFTEGSLETVRCDKPTGEMAEASFLYPELGEIEPSLSKRERMARLAQLVTHPDNGRFTRSHANRMWAKFFGHAIVEPLDDLDAEPWNDDLLDWLAVDFVDHGYDMRHLIERILTSKAYQLPVDTSFNRDEVYVFKGPLPRRLSAEQFLDTISMATQHWKEGPKFSPSEQAERYQGMRRAWQFSNDKLMRALGRSSRDQVTLRRESIPTTLQALELTNGQTFATILDSASRALLAESAKSTGEMVEMIYERTLSREPTAEEKAVAISIIGEQATREGFADFLWSLAMLPEFQYIH